MKKWWELGNHLNNQKDAIESLPASGLAVFAVVVRPPAHASAKLRPLTVKTVRPENGRLFALFCFGGRICLMT